MRAITRRRLLADALAGAGTLAGALSLTSCGAGAGRPAAASGSTLVSRWVDPVGDGQLRVGPGEPLTDRLELGARAAPGAVLATLAHLTDSHVLDASSPARVPFLDRLGNPFESTFRPHETITTQVLTGALSAIAALRPQIVIQGGDLIDNDQNNELAHALAVLAGGRVSPGSGPSGYYGVQSSFNPDPFYYRPAVDAPRHPDLLRRATRPFSSPGLRVPWFPVLGDHDILVAGEIVPTPLTTALALGTRALWDLPEGLTLPPGARLSASSSPDGPPVPGLVNELLSRALAGPTVQVPADPARSEMVVEEVVLRLRAASRAVGGPPVTDSGEPGRLDYTIDLGSHVRLIVLDLARRAGGSGGLVVAFQPAWLERALASAGKRWVIVVSHQPLTSSGGGDQVLEILDRSPRVIATLAGHTHRNRIEPRVTAAGGYWLITTASLIDFPQQARALTVVATEGEGVALRTWMLDHVFPGDLGTTSRSLAYLDAQGGRPQAFTGTRRDRNVTLYRRAVA